MSRVRRLRSELYRCGRRSVGIRVRFQIQRNRGFRSRMSLLFQGGVRYLAIRKPRTRRKRNAITGSFASAFPLFRGYHRESGHDASRISGANHGISRIWPGAFLRVSCYVAVLGNINWRRAGILVDQQTMTPFYRPHHQVVP